VNENYGRSVSYLKSKSSAEVWWLRPVTRATWEAEIRRIILGSRPARESILGEPSSKITRVKWTRGVTQVVEPLLCQYEEICFIILHTQIKLQINKLFPQLKEPNSEYLSLTVPRRWTIGTNDIVPYPTCRKKQRTDDVEFHPSAGTWLTPVIKGNFKLQSFLSLGKHHEQANIPVWELGEAHFCNLQ
jgi:hypothetical protein